MSFLLVMNILLVIALIASLVLLIHQFLTKKVESIESHSLGSEIDSRLGIKCLPPIRLEVETYHKMELLAASEGIIIQAYVRKILTEHALQDDPNAS